MKVRKMVTVLLLLALVFGMTAVPVSAAELPEGIIKVFNVARDGGTRNEAWVDKEAGIITLPVGTEFDNGGTNHGVYSLFSKVSEDDIFYVYWVVKVEENEDADGYEILSQDPSWVASGAEIGTGTSGYILDDYDYVYYYEDMNPGKWEILECGFEVTNEDVTEVQHRLHYKNVVGVQAKYLIVTSIPFEFAVNEETGEIDGITNDNEFIVVTPEPTPESTLTPESTTPPATTAPVATTAPATTTATAEAPIDDQPEDGDSTWIIIVAIAAVVVIGSIVGVVIAKKKKT